MLANRKIMDLKEMSLDEVKQIREDLIKKYIGDFEKPKQYYEQMQKLNDEIDRRLQ